MRPFSFLVLFALTGCVTVHQQQIHPNVLHAERATLKDPSSATQWANLGVAYLDSGNEDGAYSALQEAIRLESENKLAVDGLERLSASSWVSAVERSALASPGDDEVWGDVGDHFAGLGQTERALPYYLHALQLDPSDSEWQNKIAEAGATDKVLEIFERQAVGQQDNDEWLGDYGDVLRQMGRIEDACEQYRNALALDPTDSEWRENVNQCEGGTMLPPEEGTLGVLTGAGERDVEAEIASLEKLVLSEPENDEYVGRLGMLLATQGSLERGSELLNKAMRMDPTDNTWPRLVGALTGTPRVELLQELVVLHPNNDELHGDLGDMLVDLGRQEEAASAYLEATRLDPADQEWKDKLKILGK
jgi:Flp pilus assembly protein TadD